MINKNHILFTIVLLLLSSCATSHHGNFIASSYVTADKTGGEFLGTVTGESEQHWFLYIFPVGKAPSTDEAMKSAMSKIEGTRFLTDISIDDRTYWQFGYRVQVIEVNANAHK